VNFDLYKSLLITYSKDSDTCAFSRSEAWQRSTVKSCVNEVIWDSMPERVFQPRCAVCAHAHRWNACIIYFVCLL